MQDGGAGECGWIVVQLRIGSGRLEPGSDSGPDVNKLTAPKSSKAVRKG